MKNFCTIKFLNEIFCKKKNFVGKKYGIKNLCMKQFLF